MTRWAVVAALALLAAACGPRNYVVLLEDPGGGSGQVSVRNQEGRQVIDQAGQATTFNRAGRAPSEPWQVGIDKIKEVFGRAFGARPARLVRYTIYFRPGGTLIDAASESAYTAMIQDIRRRPGVDVTIDGHADTTDSEARNEIVSRLRAYAVREAIIAAGVPRWRVEMNWYGETRPIVSTGDEVAELRNRRVEVSVR